MHPLVPWPVVDRPPAALLDELAAALAGDGPALAPGDGAEPGLPAQVPDEVAVVVATSGSTGRRRGVLLDGAALLASARATHDRLGGPGRWLLAVPAAHVAGVQVLVRSVLAGVPPLAADPRDVHAIATAARGAQYAALVPAQVHRVLAAAGDRLPPELAPLAGLEAILVGGGATPPSVLEWAAALGLRLVTTYGATETCGGCVYDGVPLAGVEVAVEDGEVLIAGPVLARGLTDGSDPFEWRDGRRWLRTADLGTWADGRLTVTGRRDDVLVVGGVKVAPQAVEQVLAGLPEVGEVCVVGRADERWGQVPVAVVVPGSAAPSLESVRAAVVDSLGSAAAPRALVLVESLPLRGPGKVDRAAVALLVGR